MQRGDAVTRSVSLDSFFTIRRTEHVLVRPITSGRWLACAGSGAIFMTVMRRHAVRRTLYESPSGPAVVILSSSFGGATPNTPQAVAYYLDQAHRAHATRANSAAI